MNLAYDEDNGIIKNASDFPKNNNFSLSLAAPALDFLSVNRYDAWYFDCGRLEVIEKALANDIRNWHDMVFPIIIHLFCFDTVFYVNTCSTTSRF